MATYEITAEMNLKTLIAKTKEVAQALNEFADNLERIEKKYAEPQGSEDKGSEKYGDIVKETNIQIKHVNGALFEYLNENPRN